MSIITHFFNDCNEWSHIGNSIDSDKIPAKKKIVERIEILHIKVQVNITSDEVTNVKYCNYFCQLLLL